MAPQFSLQVNHREILGRKVKQLRKQGIIPANVFGMGDPSQSIKVDINEFIRVFDEAGETSVINLSIDGKKTIPVLVSQVDYDVVTDEVIHVDFRKVNLKEKIVANVPVELIGVAPAEKLGGIIVQSLDELEVEALPTDLPEKIEVDISVLTEIGQNVSIEDLTLAGDIEIMNEPDTVLVSAQEVTEEEPEPETEVEVTDGEEGEASEAEGSEASSEETEE